ncbi:unnamed protein product [Phytophthora fragariaefolia]|uniref:Unnamed protein product n=1 Tax=Phytophthora fragariaefolia TaxID=1490495 RepID=A0A9W6XRW9_9STRA|nr:unnamed protein product [Phytophthora fragariaefolia]
MSSHTWQPTCTGGADKKVFSRPKSPPEGHRAPREVYQTLDPHRSGRRHEEDRRAPRDSGADHLPTQSGGAGLSAATRAISPERPRLRRRIAPERQSSHHLDTPSVSDRKDPL